MCKTDEKIVFELLAHAKGKLCSRYVLGLERALNSIKSGSSQEALDEQKEWYDKTRRPKHKTELKNQAPLKVVKKKD